MKLRNLFLMLNFNFFFKVRVAGRVRESKPLPEPDPQHSRVSPIRELWRVRVKKDNLNPQFVGSS